MSSDPPVSYPSALGDRGPLQLLAHGASQASVEFESNDDDIDEIQEALVLVDEEASDSDSSVTIPIPKTPDHNASKSAAAETVPTPSQSADARVLYTCPLIHQPWTPACGSKNVIQTFIENQDTCTPMAFTTNGALDIKTSHDLNNLLKQELKGGIEVSGDWAHSLYLDVADLKMIEDYLQTSGMYNNGRWAIEEPGAEVDLYNPWRSVINSILRFFGIGGRREAIDTHGMRLKHTSDPLDPNPAPHSSSPDISVVGYGSSFVQPSRDKKIGFENMASFFDGKLDDKAGNLSEHLVQMGCYARQIFAQQPNRFFVRGLVVSHQRARLFHFDRSGAQYTALFNIHEYPRTITLACTGLPAMGGVRARGILRTVGTDKQIVEHDLLGDPISSRGSVCGRGTVCWPVKDRASGKKLLVKDYWMSEGRQLEVDLLKEIKGLPGVCQMVSYEEGRGETKDYRGNVESFPPEKFHNRIAIRIILELHGKTIDRFKSAKELLGALRDAIGAHYQLVSMGIIHRDLSHTNILIGPNSKKIGFRGILIDFDMGIKVGRTIAERLGDFRTGHPVFYSLMTWDSFMKGVDRPAHDYLDDIEVFFWIFCFLIFMRKANGEKAETKTIQNLILGWCLVNTPQLAYSVKSTFLRRTMDVNEVKLSLDESWHSICEDLFVNFKDYVRKIDEQREPLQNKKMEPFLDGTIPNRFSPVLKDHDTHYTYILSLFDDALKKAEQAAKVPRVAAVPPQDRVRTYSLNLPPPGLSQLRSQLIRGSKRRSEDTESVLEETPTRLKRYKAPGGQIATSIQFAPLAEQTASGPSTSNQG
ncbi:hypothetical protein H1R20_g10293, partial [Candolleomyces eurysporus]